MILSVAELLRHPVVMLFQWNSNWKPPQNTVLRGSDLPRYLLICNCSNRYQYFCFQREYQVWRKVFIISSFQRFAFNVNIKFGEKFYSL